MLLACLKHGSELNRLKVTVLVIGLLSSFSLSAVPISTIPLNRGNEATIVNLASEQAVNVLTNTNQTNMMALSVLHPKLPLLFMTTSTVIADGAQKGQRETSIIVKRLNDPSNTVVGEIKFERNKGFYTFGTPIGSLLFDKEGRRLFVGVNIILKVDLGDLTTYATAPIAQITPFTKWMRPLPFFQINPAITNNPDLAYGTNVFGMALSAPPAAGVDEKYIFLAAGDNVHAFDTSVAAPGQVQGDGFVDSMLAGTADTKLQRYTNITVGPNGKLYFTLADAMNPQVLQLDVWSFDPRAGFIPEAGSPFEIARSTSSFRQQSGLFGITLGRAPGSPTAMSANDFAMFVATGADSLYIVHITGTTHTVTKAPLCHPSIATDATELMAATGLATYTDTLGSQSLLVTGLNFQPLIIKDEVLNLLIGRVAGTACPDMPVLPVAASTVTGFGAGDGFATIPISVTECASGCVLENGAIGIFTVANSTNIMDFPTSTPVGKATRNLVLQNSGTAAINLSEIVITSQSQDENGQVNGVDRFTLNTQDTSPETCVNKNMILPGSGTCTIVVNFEIFEADVPNCGTRYSANLEVLYDIAIATGTARHPITLAASFGNNCQITTNAFGLNSSSPGGAGQGPLDFGSSVPGSRGGGSLGWMTLGGLSLALALRRRRRM